MHQQPHRQPVAAIAKLALIWPPYDPTRRVALGAFPADAGTLAAVVAHGYAVVAAVGGHAPYTHVVTTGTHDYLAVLEPERAARR